MIRILGLPWLLIAFGSGLVFAADELTYKAAVVEMATAVTDGDTVLVRVAARVKAIVDQINSVAAADIIVFPEYAIPEADAQSIPDVKDAVVLCDNTAYAENIFQSISCAAKMANTYVVINALTQHDCKAEQAINADERPCAANNLSVYNTNIVFNRQGALISIYRKFHIYDEAVNTTLTPDVSTFETDFNVTFGHLICFDILFEEPAASLKELGVKNFIYPAMWYSELPFLTAIQLQQNWAHAHNVNLLAAGISNPAAGSTGSGIYSGTQGALQYHFSATRASKALLWDVSKEPGASAYSNIDLPTTTPMITLLRDQLDSYTHEKLNAATNTTKTTICHETNFCCDFQYTLQDAGEQADAVAYEYVAAVFDGTRTFGGMSTLENVVSCAVFTCIDALNISSCGTITASPVINRFFFTELLITGRFRYNATTVMPNTLTVGLVPLPVADFGYNVSAPFEQGEYHYRNVSIALEQYDKQLLTFGIWGRSSAASTAVAMALVVLAAIISLSFR